MCSDPNPIHAAFDIGGEGPVVRSNTHRPELTDFLEVQGGMSGIRLEELIVLVRKLLDVGR